MNEPRLSHFAGSGSPTEEPGWKLGGIRQVVDVPVATDESKIRHPSIPSNGDAPTIHRKAFHLAKLIYSVISSLDGYFEDAAGKFDWAEPDEEVHAFANDLDRPIGTYLYGRRMYETMAFWETASTEADVPAVYRDFAEIWQATEKVVYSRTLQAPMTTKTRIEGEFEPEAIRVLKLSSTADIAIAGGDLAGQAIAAGLVDECHLTLCPIVVGGGKRALPDNIRSDLELLEVSRFEKGVVHLHYRVVTPDPEHPRPPVR